MKKISVNYSTKGIECGYLLDEQVIAIGLGKSEESVIFAGYSLKNERVYVCDDVMYVFVHENGKFDHETQQGYCEFRRFNGGTH